MQLTALGLMLLLVLALPSSAFAEIDGIVYSISNPSLNDQIEIDSEILSNITSVVKLYDNQLTEQAISEFYKKEIDVYVGLNITDDGYGDRLDRYIGLANEYPNVIAIILESDPIDTLSEFEILEIVNYIKHKGVNVSVASTPENWDKMKNVFEAVDFPYYYFFDYWNGLSASQSITKLQLFHEKMRDFSPVYELGYPSNGDMIGTSLPSLDNQRIFLHGLDDFDGRYVLFSYSDEKEKGFKLGFPGNMAENNFGIFEDDVPKFGLDYKIQPKPIFVGGVHVLDTGKTEYHPKLFPDKSKPQILQEMMKIEIASDAGSVNVHYHDTQEQFPVIDHLDIFLELDNYDDVKIIGDSIDSISFFSLPRALAQCEFDSVDCVYLDDTGNNDYLQYLIIMGVMGIVFGLGIVNKFRKKKLPNKPSFSLETGMTFLAGLGRCQKSLQKNNQKCQTFLSKLTAWIKNRKIHDVQFNLGIMKFKIK